MGNIAAIDMEPPALEMMAPQNILIVDDEPRIRAAYRQLLTADGRRVEEGDSGAAALRRLERNDIDVLVLDLGLPDMTGIQVMEWMERHHISATVIVFSADERIESAILALRRGAFEFIRKSCEPEELLQAVTNALYRRRLEQSHALMTARIEQSERLHRFLVEHSPDIIYTLDADGKFIFINGRIESLLGYERQELVGRHYSFIVHEEDQDKARYVFQERRSGDRATVNVEIRLKCKGVREGFRHFDNSMVVAMLSSLGIYESDRDSACRRFMGTYGVARDITDRKKAEETISFQAFHDLLTCLPNRALFRDRLELAVAHARRNGTRVGVMFIDLDRFKLVNDTYGHAAGDELIKVFAQRVRHCLRAGDTLAREGGDEFTVLLPDLARSENAAAIAEKILAAQSLAYDLGGREFRATASIGIALYPDDTDKPEALIRAADIAMYQVKMRGKNGYQCYHRDMSASHDRRIAFETDLRHALDRGQFELHYQPQVSLSAERVTGVEALIRWRHPDHGLLNPGSFISIAEESGLICAISDWVLDTGCKAMVRWLQAGLPALKLSVNISPHEFDRDDLVERVVSSARRHGLPLGQLEVEITESLLMDDVQNVIEKVRELRKCGVHVSIDDFGTRYSSLNYLRRFPISSIKIDQSFVRDLDGSHGAESIIHAILGIARGFGLHVVAEGVEHRTQLDILQAMGCDEIQGYLFSRPLPEDQLENLLRRGSAGLAGLLPQVHSKS